MMIVFIVLCVAMTASSTWERLNATGSLPSAQSSATVVYNKMLVTFGGIINGIAQNCLHSLDVGKLFCYHVHIFYISELL